MRSRSAGMRSGSAPSRAARSARRPPLPDSVGPVMRLVAAMMRVARELDRKPALVYRWARRFGLPVAEFRPKEKDGGGSSAADADDE